MAHIYLLAAIICAAGGWFIPAGVFGVAALLTYKDGDFQNDK